MGWRFPTEGASFLGEQMLKVIEEAGIGDLVTWWHF